jgi:hypothetical protein
MEKLNPRGSNLEDVEAPISLREQLAGAPSRLILIINVSKRLSAVVPQTKARVTFFDKPGRREAAFRHRERPRPEVRCSTAAPALPGKRRNARLPLVQTLLAVAFR